MGHHPLGRQPEHSLDHLDIGGGEAAIHLTYGEGSESLPAEGPVDHVTLEDALLHDSEYTALDCTPGPCNEVTIRRVEVFGSGLRGDDSYGADGIAITRGYPILVEDCFVHDNGGDGIDLNSRDREGNATDVVVRRNRVVRNHQNGIKLWAGGRIENNLIWGQGNTAVWSGSFPSTLEIVNNTIAYNMWETSYGERNYAMAIGYPEEMESPPVALTLVNNIVAFNADPSDGGPTGVYLGPGVTLIRESSNLFHSQADAEIAAEFVTGRDTDISRDEIADGTWAGATGQGQGDLVADPRFIAGWPQADLHLLPDSPALGAAPPDVAPPDDLDGRPRSGPVDLGAYESGN